MNTKIQQDPFANLVARSTLLSAQGKSSRQIAAEFRAIGITEDLAEMVAIRGEELKDRQFRKNARVSLAFGAGLTALGMAKTYWAYLAAGAAETAVATTTSSFGGVLALVKGLCVAWLVA